MNHKLKLLISVGCGIDARIKVLHRIDFEYIFVFGCFNSASDTKKEKFVNTFIYRKEVNQ